MEAANRAFKFFTDVMLIYRFLLPVLTYPFLGDNLLDYHPCHIRLSGQGQESAVS
jgi:hypothetical protein